ncbi:MAG: sulfurtransferase TusA family protein [Deltaproteobacteria bacterium]|nr:sulfurtransferase TusA family protein [Deltaproteobacteria bacterium]
MKEIDIEGNKVTVTSTVDAVGMFCPIPIVKLKLEIEQLDSAQVLEVLADDPGFELDVASWCKETKNKLLSLGKNQDNLFVAYIEKT